MVLTLPNANILHVSDCAMRFTAAICPHRHVFLSTFCFRGQGGIRTPSRRQIARQLLPELRQLSKALLAQPSGLVSKIMYRDTASATALVERRPNFRTERWRVSVPVSQRVVVALICGRAWLGAL